VTRRCGLRLRSLCLRTRKLRHSAKHGSRAAMILPFVFETGVAGPDLMPDFTALGIVPRCRQWGFPTGREGGRRVEGCDVTSISRSIRRDAASGASAHGGDRGKLYMGKIIDSGDRYVCITYTHARVRAHVLALPTFARLGMLRARRTRTYACV